MSGFYDCWDLGGLDTTLNGYLAGIRSNTVPSAAASVITPPSAVPPSEAFVASTQPASLPPVPPPQVMQPQVMQPQVMQPQVMQPQVIQPQVMQPQYVSRRKKKLGLCDIILPALLSPTVCLFLWIAIVVIIVIKIIGRRKKAGKYVRVRQRSPYPHMHESGRQTHIDARR